MEDFRQEWRGPQTNVEIYQVFGDTKSILNKTLFSAIEMMGEWSWELRDDGRMYCTLEMSDPDDAVGVEIHMVVPGKPIEKGDT